MYIPGNNFLDDETIDERQKQRRARRITKPIRRGEVSLTLCIGKRKKEASKQPASGCCEKVSCTLDFNLQQASKQQQQFKARQ